MDKTHTRRANYKILYDFYSHYIRGNKSGLYTYSDDTALTPMVEDEEIKKYHGKLEDKGYSYDKTVYAYESAYYFTSELAEFNTAEEQIMVFPKWILKLEGKERAREYSKVRSQIIKSIVGSYGIPLQLIDCDMEDNSEYSLKVLGEKPQYIGKYTYECSIDNDSIKQLQDTLEKEFGEETQYSLAKFYEILVSNYQKYGRTDGILEVDTFEDVSYNAVFGALLHFSYSNDVELIEHSKDSFKLKLIALENTEINSTSQFPIDLSPQLEAMLVNKSIEAFKVTKDSNGKPYMLFSESYTSSKDTSFIDICSKHPHAKIQVETYEGKPTGYHVTDKTKPGENIES